MLRASGRLGALSLQQLGQVKALTMDKACHGGSTNEPQCCRDKPRPPAVAQAVARVKRPDLELPWRTPSTGIGKHCGAPQAGLENTGTAGHPSKPLPTKPQTRVASWGNLACCMAPLCSGGRSAIPCAGGLQRAHQRCPSSQRQPLACAGHYAHARAAPGVAMQGTVFGSQGAIGHYHKFGIW